MAYGVNIILLIWHILTLLLSISAMPPTRTLSSRNVRDESQCVRASQQLGSLLYRPDVFRTAFHLHSLTLREFVEGFTGLDLFDADFRRDILCRLEGIETVDELTVLLQRWNLLEQSVKLAYGYVASYLPVIKTFTLEALENGWVDEPILVNLHMEFINHLEATGFLTTESSDASESKLFIDAYIWEPETLESVKYPKVPLSTLPRDTQCTRLASDLRNIFDYEVSVREGNNPGIRRNWMDTFKDWTGIQLTFENTENIICGLLDAVLDGSLPQLYSYVKQLDVFPSVVRQGYPILAQTIKESAERLDILTDVVDEMEEESDSFSETYLYEYLYGDSLEYEFGYYPEDFFEVMARLGRFYHLLDDMGLLDLRD